MGGRQLGTTYRIVAAVGNLGYDYTTYGIKTSYSDDSYVSPANKSAWYGWIDNVGNVSATTHTGYGGSTGMPLPRLTMAGQMEIPLAPSNQPMLGDIFNKTDSNLATFYPSVGSSWGGGTYRENHSDGLNVGFADGHVKWSNKDNLHNFIQYYTGGTNGQLWW
jgi:prepilin-type processing-associated H-X9-DG protein